jgi:glycerol-3-phosphate dehydrogenase (NAD(P)+)
MKKHDVVAIVGAGKLGSALGALIGEGRVRYWDVDPRKCGGAAIADVVGGADIVFFCVPSWALDAALEAARPHFRRGAIGVCISKGLEPASGLSVDALFRRHFAAGHPFVFLGGAMLAAELVSGQGGVGLVASTAPAAAKRVASLFAGSDLVLGRTADVRGTAMAGVLKNVYAMGLGMADGLGWGSDRKGWLASKAAAEMAAVIPALGGKRAAAAGPAGLADLLATGFSMHSTHRKAGYDLATAGRMEAVCEGAGSVPHLARRLGKPFRREYPVLAAVHDVVCGCAPASSLARVLETP